MSQGNPLLRPAILGDLVLPNRVVMAPTTRCRGSVPSDLHALHYARRASAGLIIAEGTLISPQDVPFPNVPGLFTTAQVAGWRRVTDLVHSLGGRIFVQLWHAGTRPLPSSEVTSTIADYRTAAANALRAGFDGVEIAANGTYLIAQFLNPRLNHRTDAYGELPRLLLDILDAVHSTGARVGVRLSPYWSPTDSAPPCPDYFPDEETLSHYDDLVRRLDSPAYLHLRGPASFDLDAFSRYRKLFDGFLIANNGFSPDTASAAVESDLADAVSFARHFIANPDLVTRFALTQELAVADKAHNYTGGPIGYI
ncbi:oxidoreductase [Kutzneria sp. CA-103260]|uniref:oxidoreductase n=1 Tax=Kutzneria sp. CA-103260 TaxID=2802641 RepID=UPI001BA94255|nr:alkene reductase [Kutzneria sp. CA-103260]QUQ69461.1 N-ethylmaleimide reductase [Kutzneria sp. CA-103260]